jgi:CDP-diacylglycerol pyrophosphatase
MTFETEHQKRSIKRWSRLAIQLNGAAESGRFDHVTTAVIKRELEHDRVFDFLRRELPAKGRSASSTTSIAITRKSGS